ncbi:MAG: dTMP kinase [Candidatus Dojkabacteria bacterium]
MLKICKNLFETFNKKAIEYVIVKSIERIELDTSGEAQDIDILISQKDKERSEKTMGELGFKKVLFPNEFDGLGFYIGYDQESRKQILLHIHNKLRIGDKKHKEFHLKIEDGILRDRVFNKKYNVYTTSPQFEFCTLLFRMILKGRHKQEDLKRLTFLSKDLKIEDKELFELMGSVLDIPIDSFVGFEFTSEAAYSLHKKYNSNMRKQLSKSFKEKVRIFCRVIDGYWVFLLKIVSHLFGFPRYIVRKTGKLVALQGIDGSGKSTQMSYLLETKFLQMTGMKRMYGGNNEYWIPGLKKASIFFSTRKDRISKGIKAMLSILTIVDRRLRLIPAFINILQGKIVIFDRYFYDDLSYLPKMNRSKKSTSLVKKLAKKVFMGRLGYTPHLTIFLDIEAEDAYKRKKDYPIEKVKIQIEAYREIFTGRKEVKTIDANKTPEIINQEIMGLINGL